MLNKLRTRLILILLGGMIFSILIVSFITNVTVFDKFNIYMQNEQKDRIDEIADYIETSYAAYKQWNEEDLEKLHGLPFIENFDVTLKDQNGEIIFAHYMTTNMMGIHSQMINRMGHSMMGEMSRRMMPSAGQKGEYRTERFQLTLQRNLIGTLEIGYIGPFIISEGEIEFTRGINTSIIVGAFISFVAAMILGAFFSKVISKPITNITKASHDIRHGKLDTRIKESTKIQELKELSYAINYLAASLKKQNALRKRLTSDIAHELRTPLTVLHSHMEAIHDGIWEPTQERMGIFKNEVERLMKLVEQLKHLTDIESDDIALEIEKFNLSQSIHEIIENFRYQYEEKNIQLNHHIEDNVFMKGDRDKIIQVIINLLSNAWKFTNPEDHVTVRLNELQEYVTIEVEDTGMGIAKEDLPYVFERFYRGEKSRSRSTGGAGIGLTITKKLVEAHQGTIKVVSEIEKGTQFIVKFPKIT
ncbi:MAG: sensor histidine kinase [Bacillota bacterium]